MLPVIVVAIAAGCGHNMSGRGEPTPVGHRPPLSCSASPCPWKPVPLPRLGVTTMLTGIAAASRSDVWVAASAGPGWSKPQPGVDNSWAQLDPHVVLLHWNGHSWSRSVFPRIRWMGALTMVSPSSVWGFVAETRLLHWDGKSWRSVDPVKSPNAGSLSDLAAIRPDDLWLVGARYTRDGSGALILRGDGASWRRVAVPSIGKHSELHAVAVASASDAWALGSQYEDSKHNAETTSKTGILIEHWDGQRWAVVRQPVYRHSKRHFEFADAAMTSPSDGWAVGTQVYSGGGRLHPLVIHWNGHSWQNMQLPYCCAGATLTSVVARSPSDVWVGGAGTGSTGGSETLIEHWDGQRWYRVPTLNLGGSRIEQLTATLSSPLLAAGTGSNENGTEYALLQAQR